MKPMRLWAHVWSCAVAFGLLCVSGLSAAEPAGVRPKLPSSAEAPQGLWLNMIPKSYGEDIATVRKVCEQNAAISPVDALMKEKCNRLVRQLQAGECEVVWVPDGIRLSLLNGLQHSKPHTWFNMEKQTGRSDRALLCDLSEGLYSYWFTGDGAKSCNNLGFVFRPLPPTPHAEWVCKMVPVNTSWLSTRQPDWLGSITSENCCCGIESVTPELDLSFRNTLQSTGYTEVCGWE
ncbi:hypothetical protein H6778_02800 [Candidatus Nomurabacteria bacterium]|nr:hypothetical protein [Candidatus Nomurabacteria bacterium]